MFICCIPSPAADFILVLNGFAEEGIRTQTRGFVRDQTPRFMEANLLKPTLSAGMPKAGKNILNAEQGGAFRAHCYDITWKTPARTAT